MKRQDGCEVTVAGELFETFGLGFGVDHARVFNALLASSPKTVEEISAEARLRPSRVKQCLTDLFDAGIAGRRAEGGDYFVGDIKETFEMLKDRRVAEMAETARVLAHLERKRKGQMKLAEPANSGITQLGDSFDSIK
ncbi:MAG: helix-turn-helix domain-containing protein [Candidatus Diapherotrites archaeon]